MRRAACIALFLPWLMCLGATCSRNTPPPRIREPGLVDITSIDPSIRLDIRYATPRNFTGRAVYSRARALLQRPVAEALSRVNGALRKEGYGLVVFDAYRPWRVTKLFWDITPADEKRYVAPPGRGSGHNRGCAVDVTLYDLGSGKEVDMPGGYDERTPRSHADYRGGAPETLRHRDILRAAMEVEGFSIYRYEWWHFSHELCGEYPILDIPF